MKYNLHATVHLADDAKRYGPLDNVASFVFENYLGKLKKMVRKPQAPLQQVVRRLSERCNTTNSVSVDILQKEHFAGPVPSHFCFCKQYKEYEKPGYKITIFDNNNCVMIGNDVVLVRNFIDVNSDQL